MMQTVAALALALAGAETAPLQDWKQPTPAVQIRGLAAYYRAGLMDEVARNRGMDLAGYAGGVALMRAGDLGRSVWIQVPAGTSAASEATLWEGPFLVVDCSRADHYAANVDRGHVVELARSTWLAFGLPEWPVTVTVRFLPPWSPAPHRTWPR